MALNWNIMAQSRDLDLIRRQASSFKQEIIVFRHFVINRWVWFFYRNYGWREGIVSKRDLPTIIVAYKKTALSYTWSLYPPSLWCFLHPARYTISASPRSSPINNALALQLQKVSFFYLPLRNINILIHINSWLVGCIDSDNVLVTIAKNVKDISIVYLSDNAAFGEAIKDGIDFLLRDYVCPGFLSSKEISSVSKLQILIWTLNIKDSSNPHKHGRYRDRLVSASNRSGIRLCIHWNAPSVAFSTIRIFCAVLWTWIELHFANNPTINFCREVTKAILQSTPLQRLIMYNPPKQLYNSFPQFFWAMYSMQIFYFMVRFRLVFTYIAHFFFGYFRISKIYNNQFMTRAFASYNLSIAVLLCTDNMLVAVPKSKLPFEEQILSQSRCRERDHRSTDFTGIDIKQNDRSISITQKGYLDHLSPSNPACSTSQSDSSRSITDYELSSHLIVAVRLAWIATASSLSSSFSASVSLQGNIK